MFTASSLEGSPEHLTPCLCELTSFSVHFEYYRTLRNILFQNPNRDLDGYIFCMFTIPSFEREELTLIGNDGKGNYIVRSIAANQQLYDLIGKETDRKNGKSLIYKLKNYFQRSEIDKVQLTISEKSISQKVALKVAEVCEKMIAETRYNITPLKKIDGVSYVFSNAFGVCARADFAYEDSLTGKLVSIGESLHKYAKCKNEQSERIENDIYGKSIELINEIKGGS